MHICWCAISKITGKHKLNAENYLELLKNSQSMYMHTTNQWTTVHMYTTQLHIPFHYIFSFQNFTVTQYIVTPSNAHVHKQLTKCQSTDMCQTVLLPSSHCFKCVTVKFPNSVILTYFSCKSWFYSILHSKVIFRKAHGLVIVELFFIINAFWLYMLPKRCDY